jgi:hypothetical protein
MSSHARSSREEGRRLSIRTLIFASVGSAVAAILTSQFWITGTPIAAALTPVIVALVSELLHRPTERIAQRLTTDVPALRQTDTLPEAAGAGPPPREEERDPRPAREPPMADPRGDPAGRRPPPGARPPRPGPAPEYRVHRTGTPASRLPWKVILATAAAAFAIAATLLTLPELIAGHALFGGDGDTTLGGGGRGSDREAPAPQETEPQQTEPQPTSPEPEQTEPEETQPPETQPDERTTPTTPSTTTQPAQPRASPPAAPAPRR